MYCLLVIVLRVHEPMHARVDARMGEYMDRRIYGWVNEQLTGRIVREGRAERVRPALTWDCAPGPRPRCKRKWPWRLAPRHPGPAPSWRACWQPCPRPCTVPGQ